ncbi:TPA: helix-turn-helix domain-containing protein [Stenotrophomonas maltophilia]|jgi:DNA-binding IclR family transcriptional regulator|uniref:helix-turn-helix domain-containing protein n=1 Tax=Stenotrophomonas TaxID=40323 RepID=UPI00066BC1A4|nr:MULTISPECIES: helix-turn-helix domain-containing protein [Stenotrophomonas]EMB2831418.1 helix-turn-helix domain-containing protein [Stenotrophomonas maltophilia]MBA0423821.1 MarR family transcriptional regulator [Stenotrophomonas maltophilia]MBH1412062.1 helix-turn-helix domain-containing protein [Stenotrophomonas maltophilia]MBH1453246.1 helix-turn-helix domain-containing protein [Stenotrophomonas maltophilia]MBH1529812.1 helix-turn-helix domain-containing protein [Stenotrophomonas maltoph
MSEQSIFARLLFGLAGHSRSGLRLKQIADGIGESPSTTLRNLQRLAEDGLVERSPYDQDNWRLSPRIVQIALAHLDEVLREERQLDDFKNRYSRSPN